VVTGEEPMSTAPDVPTVVMMTLEATVGAGEMVPEMVMLAIPEYDAELVDRVIVDVAPKAATGPKTRKAARMTVAIVLIVFISITW
jgi:hypothetical protein